MCRCTSHFFTRLHIFWCLIPKTEELFTRFYDHDDSLSFSQVKILDPKFCCSCGCFAICSFSIWKLLNGRRWRKFLSHLFQNSRNNCPLGSLHVQDTAWYVIYTVRCIGQEPICSFKDFDFGKSSSNPVVFSCLVQVPTVAVFWKPVHSELCFCTDSVGHKAACSGWSFKRTHRYCNRWGDYPQGI